MLYITAQCTQVEIYFSSVYVVHSRYVAVDVKRIKIKTNCDGHNNRRCNEFTFSRFRVDSESEFCWAELESIPSPKERTFLALVEGFFHNTINNVIK